MTPIPKLQSASAPVRIIRTMEGDWRVYERASVYDRRIKPDLVFESDGVIRRVREYPSNWAELSDAALMSVSWGR
jgi:hypothetical protein